MIFKNVAGQGVYLFTFDNTGAAKTGDAGNITGAISKGGAASNPTGTANPTEIGGGVYWQPLSQAETNADAIAVYWASTTLNVFVDPVIVYTQAGTIPKVAAGANGGLPTCDASNKVASKFDWAADVSNKPDIGTSDLAVADLNTAVASIVGADGDTLKVLSDQLDGLVPVTPVVLYSEGTDVISG